MQPHVPEAYAADIEYIWITVRDILFNFVKARSIRFILFFDN